MSSSIVHKLPNKAGYYTFFDSIKKFNDFVDVQTTVLKESNKAVWANINSTTASNLQNGTTWYGTPTPKNIDELNEHKYFLGMPLLKKIQSKIKEKLKDYLKLLSEVAIEKPKVAYNDRGLGVFSFDRAAMGLYRLHPTNTKTPIDKVSSQIKIELDEENKTTAVKSVYAYFKNKKVSYPALKLYLLAGGNANISGDRLLYVGLACAELVEFMELLGVAVEVNVMLGTSFRNKIFMGVIRAKRFQDRLDKNQLLLTSSDPRYFRYRGFKGIIALSDHFNHKVPDSLGSIKETMGKQFVETLSDTNTYHVVFEQSYSLDTAVKEVTRIITEYAKQLK